jgi:hypothetical protein
LLDDLTEAGVTVFHPVQKGTMNKSEVAERYGEGGMAIAAGNGIVSGTPIENIHAFLDEAVNYGTKHRQNFPIQ